MSGSRSWRRWPSWRAWHRCRAPVRSASSRSTSASAVSMRHGLPLLFSRSLSSSSVSSKSYRGPTARLGGSGAVSRCPDTGQAEALASWPLGLILLQDWPRLWLAGAECYYPKWAMVIEPPAAAGFIICLRRNRMIRPAVARKRSTACPRRPLFVFPIGHWKGRARRS